MNVSDQLYSSWSESLDLYKLNPDYRKDILTEYYMIELTFSRSHQQKECLQRSINKLEIIFFPHVGFFFRIFFSHWGVMQTPKVTMNHNILSNNNNNKKIIIITYF